MSSEGRFVFEADVAEKLKDAKVGIVTAQWHTQYTSAMASAARETLLNAGISEENILSHQVPGAFELALGTQYMFEFLNVNAVVAIGCLVKGETPHFHYISEAATGDLSKLALRYNRPVGFGLLTVDNEEQARERVGGKHGNKGEEAADAVLRMMQLRQQLKDGPAKTGSKSVGFSRQS